MGVAVEKSPKPVLELRELLLTWVSLVPFNVVIQHVNGFRFKKFAKFRVLVDHVSQPHFLDVGVDALVSESSVKHGEGEKGEDFEAG